jgi:hypothetical protein
MSTIITITPTRTSRVLLAVAALALLTRGGCRTDYFADYGYKQTGNSTGSLNVMATAAGVAVKPSGTTVLCDGASIIDEEGKPHAVVCSTLEPKREMDAGKWQASLVREANGGTVTIVPADYVASWPGNAVRFTPLLPIIKGPRQWTLSGSRESTESFAQQQVGKTIVLELPVRTGGDVVRQRYELQVSDYKIRTHPF